MIVRNWMRTTPTTITGDMLLAEAYRIFSEQNIRAIPVVEDDSLRGLLTRAHCLRAAENVARTQDNSEFDYFTNKLKVRDIMVRNPATINASDTMEYCLRIGQEDGKSQFPVLDDGKVVGIITATEIFSMAAHVIGAWDNCSGITLQASNIKPEDINRITALVTECGARLQSIYPIPKEGEGFNRIIIRFQPGDLNCVVEKLETEGFQILEKNSQGKPVVDASDNNCH